MRGRRSGPFVCSDPVPVSPRPREPHPCWCQPRECWHCSSPNWHQELASLPTERTFRLLRSCSGVSSAAGAASLLVSAAGVLALLFAELAPGAGVFAAGADLSFAQILFRCLLGRGSRILAGVSRGSAGIALRRIGTRSWRLCRRRLPRRVGIKRDRLALRVDARLRKLPGSLLSHQDIAALDRRLIVSLPKRVRPGLAGCPAAARSVELLAIAKCRRQLGIKPAAC